MCSCYWSCSIYTDLFTEGAVCTVNTTTGLIYTNTSTRGGKFELLDGENCTVYKLTPNNNASTGEITLSVPFCVGDQEYTKLYVSLSFDIIDSGSLYYLW